MPPLEAMASRTPVLVSNTSALPEICADHALYCDPYRIGDIADGLARLGRLSGEARDQRVAKAFNHAASFNWDRATAATLKVLKDSIL
jgi:glycosyltransferase involved in cell wall biosynthesis